jgi:hypothetical protein
VFASTAPIDAVLKADAARATGLYETFLAGCAEKAEEESGRPLRNAQSSPSDRGSTELNVNGVPLAARRVKGRWRGQPGSESSPPGAELPK